MSTIDKSKGILLKSSNSIDSISLHCIILVLLSWYYSVLSKIPYATSNVLMSKSMSSKFIAVLAATNHSILVDFDLNY